MVTERGQPAGSRTSASTARAGTSCAMATATRRPSPPTRQILPASDPAAVTHPYDAVLVLSFGGPEGPNDVVPFLRNVTRGRDIPAARLAEAGRHYEWFGGVSPINAQ